MDGLQMGTIWVLWGHLAMAEVLSQLYNRGSRCYQHLMGDVRDVAKHLMIHSSPYDKELSASQCQ